MAKKSVTYKLVRMSGDQETVLFQADEGAEDSKSGKSIVLASTRGFQTVAVPDAAPLGISLNITRRK